jgi:hypothetical protein
MRGLASQRQKRANVSKNFPTPTVPPRQVSGGNVSTSKNESAAIKNTKTNSQISVSDAIGLICIRLSNLENRLISGGSISSEESPNNMQMVNKDTIISVVNRLEEIEKSTIGHIDFAKRLEEIEKSTTLGQIQSEFDEIQSNMQIFEDKLNEMYIILDKEISKNTKTSDECESNIQSAELKLVVTDAEIIQGEEFEYDYEVEPDVLSTSESINPLNNSNVTID